MILIYFMAPQLVSWIGGKDYTEAIFPLKILGFAILFGFINSIFVYIVIAKNRQQKILFISISGAVLSIILNLLFIPLYSYKACAVIAVFIGFYGMAFMGYLAYRASGFNPFLSISLKKTT